MLRRRLLDARRDDRGASIVVVFLVFFPLFLATLVMLIEASRLQALRGQNDIVSHIAANAAVRQADYAALEDGSATKIRLVDGGGEQPAEYDNPASIQALYGDPNALLLDPAKLDRVDALSTQTMARLMYHANANLNGLNTKMTLGASGGGTTASPDDGITVTVHNLDYTGSWNYYNGVLGVDGTANYPGVELATTTGYQVTSLLNYLTFGQLTEMDIHSQTVAQVVPSRSGQR